MKSQYKPNAIDIMRQKYLSVPEWAKAEHMETIIPEKVLWTYSKHNAKKHMKSGIIITTVVTAMIVILWVWLVDLSPS